MWGLLIWMEQKLETIFIIQFLFLHCNRYGVYQAGCQGVGNVVVEMLNLFLLDC
jgi:hypothetical protein